MEIREIIGRKFKPTFNSNIERFEVIGYDEERQMVLTIAYPKEGSHFNDEIEEKCLSAAFEIGEYVFCEETKKETNFSLYNSEIMLPFYNDMEALEAPTMKREVFNGVCCSRCIHRFGRTSNSEYCQRHFMNDRCYRFKLEK